MTSQHQLEQIGDGFSILLDLAFGSRVQDGQAGVNVPFVRIDAESDVDLHILNTTHISRHFPGGNWLLAAHAVPMERKAAWVTACVSAVMRS